MKLNDNELEALLNDFESDRAERKETFNGDAPEKFRQAIYAFANDLPNHAAPGVVMTPIGYLAPQHGVRLYRPVKAYDRWLNWMPLACSQSVLGKNASKAPAVAADPECPALLQHYHSLAPMAMEARKPLFLLRSADGAIGAHSYAVQDAYNDFQILAKKVLERVCMAQTA